MGVDFIAHTELLDNTNSVKFISDNLYISIKIIIISVDINY